ncbi:hypothetical protein WJX81_006045 [Elliptochloris bilobata]|uniref:SURF1-like protein n=1 Tax=Elliptochloris bilobata TaxID=381761 RepID=A0AAW1RFZ6_9CHLO
MKLKRLHSCPAAHSAASEAAQAARGRTWWLLLIPSAISGFLGVWQVQRLQWKDQLLSDRAAALQALPVAVSETAGSPLPYTRVTCHGQLLHERSFLVGPRPRSSMGQARPGYVLITPLVTEGWERAVLVNRGWVPAAWRDDAALRSHGEPSGQVEVEGIVRGSEQPSRFVPANDAASGQWFWIDVPALSHAAGLPMDTPLVEVVDAGGGSPQRGTVPTTMDVLALRAQAGAPAERLPSPRPAGDLLAFSVMPSDHRNYAATWFTLSGATALLALRAAR